MPTGALQDKTSSLARQLARDLVKSRGQVTRLLCLGKTDILHSKHTPV